MRELTIDPDVLRGVIFWQILNHHPTYQSQLLKLIVPQIQPSQNKADLRINIRNAATEQNEVAEQADIMRSINQSQHEGVPLSRFAKDLAGLRALAIRKNLPDIANRLDIKKTKPESDKEQKSIEAEEINADLNTLVTLNGAMAAQDFVLVDFCISSLNQEELLTDFLEKKQRALFFILMFVNNKFTQELCSQFPDKAGDIVGLINSAEEQGVLLRFIDHGSVVGRRNDIRTRDEVSLQRRYFENRGVSADIFLRNYLFLHSPNQEASQLDLAQFSRNRFLMTTRHAMHLGINLAPNDSISGVSKYSRLDELRTNFFLANYDARLAMLECLDAKDRARFACTSRQIYHASVPSELSALTDFLFHLNIEINQKSFFADRFYNYPWEKLIPFAFVILLTIPSVVGGIYEGRLGNRIGALNDAIRTTHDPGVLDPWYNCSSYIEGDESYYSPNICEELYNQLHNLQFIELICGAFLAICIMINIGSLLLVGHNYINGEWSLSQLFLPAGKERYDSLPLTVFSPSLQEEAKQLFNQLKLPLAASTKSVRSRLTEVGTGLSVSTFKSSIFHHAPPITQEAQETKQDGYEQVPTEEIAALHYHP